MNDKENVEILSDQDVVWHETKLDDFFESKEFRSFLEKSRSHTEETRIYTTMEFFNIDKVSAEKFEKLLNKLRSKDKIIKKLSVKMKKALERKNKKLSKMLKYISLLEQMLEDNNVDFVSMKQRIKDGEISLTSRKLEGEVMEAEDFTDEYIDAIEIELDEEGNEINPDED